LPHDVPLNGFSSARSVASGHTDVVLCSTQHSCFRFFCPPRCVSTPAHSCHPNGRMSCKEGRVPYFRSLRCTLPVVELANVLTLKESTAGCSTSIVAQGRAPAPCGAARARRRGAGHPRVRDADGRGQIVHCAPVYAVQGAGFGGHACTWYVEVPGGWPLYSTIFMYWAKTPGSGELPVRIVLIAVL